MLHAGRLTSAVVPSGLVVRYQVRTKVSPHLGKSKPVGLIDVRLDQPAKATNLLAPWG